MSDKIDEIVDRLIKGGRGSGRRGHKTAAPASDIKRELDPSKKKGILASDRKAAKKEVKGHTPEELQATIDSHKELSESQHLSPASRESYAAKHKALVSHQKKMKLKETISPEKEPEGIASRPGPFGNINKGGPGSGKKGSGKTEVKHFSPNANLRDKDKDLDRISPEEGQKRRANAKRLLEERVAARKETNINKGGAGSGKKGHTTQKHLEQLKGQMGSKHIMQHGDKGSAFSTAHRQGKSEVFHHPSTDSYHVVTEGGGVNHLKDHEDFKRLGAPHDKDPAAAGNKASREDASGTTDLDQVYGDTGTQDKSKGDTRKLDLEQMRGGVPSMHERKKKLDKSLETLFYMNQLANEGRIKPKQKRSMRKADEARLPASTDTGASGSAGPSDDWWTESVTDRGVQSPEPGIKKVLPFAAKTAFRVVQNLVKPASGGDGSEADNPVGGHDGASVAGGVGGAKKTKGPEAPKMKKSLAERLDDMYKSGIGSGRKGHHSIGRDYSDVEHDSVFEDSEYDSTQEREIAKDHNKRSS